MTTFNPQDPAWKQKIQDSFDRQGFMVHLQARVVASEPGQVILEAPFRPEFTQQHGFFHAGVTSSLADTAGGYAAYSLYPADSSVLTVEFKINLLAPAKGEKLKAVGTVIKPGRTLTICELKVYAIEGTRETLCAVGQQTLICLAGKLDRQQ